jgi:hypothetical protein
MLGCEDVCEISGEFDLSLGWIARGVTVEKGWVYGGGRVWWRGLVQFLNAKYKIIIK